MLIYHPYCISFDHTLPDTFLAKETENLYFIIYRCINETENYSFFSFDFQIQRN